jgi:DNA-binding HxlR family transcriptional regulator
MKSSQPAPLLNMIVRRTRGFIMGLFNWLFGKRETLEQISARIAALEKDARDLAYPGWADRVLCVAFTKPGNYHDIAREIGCAWEAVRAGLNELAEDGLVEITKQLGPYDSEWGITEAGRRNIQASAKLNKTLNALRLRKAKLEKAAGK